MPSGGPPTAPSPRAVVAVMAGMIGAWLAAGSMGLLAHPLRHALTWLSMAVMLVAGWPQGRRAWKEWGILAAAILAGLILTVPAHGVYNVLGPAVVLAVVARVHAGIDGRALGIAAFAVTVLGVFRLACTAIATVWLAADWAGQALGAVAATILGRPLLVGATFGGVDFLVLMAALFGAWLCSTPRPRWGRAACALAAILVGHLGYLMILACSTDLAAALPVHGPTPEPPLYVPPPWLLSDALRTLFPWNVPALAGLIHAAIAACMFRWAKWKAENGKPKADSADTVRNVRFPLSAFRFSLALLIPVVTAVSPVNCDLSGRKIVAYERGNLNWDKPVHDRYGRSSAGLYGMFPTLVSCLGGTLARSADLSEEALAGADVLVVIHPMGPWPQDRLQRVWDYVRRGGSLLVVAEPWAWENGQMSSFNDLLGPTAMAVRFDTAIGETGVWQHALHAVAHPATAGIGDQRGRFGLGLGSSIETAWPARPLVIGRFGWSDPGSDAVLTRQYRFDPGERLGDLVLAAEQRIGTGTVCVLGDATALQNEGLSNGYEFVGRLLGYLAGHRAGPQAGWRQALGLAGCLLLLGLLAWRLDPGPLAWSSLLLAVSFGFSTMISAAESKVLPDGGKTSPNCLACIDASHLESYRGYPWLETGLAGEDPSEVSEDEDSLPTRRLWRDTGIGGLELNLMRNGYLPIRIPQLTAEQLRRAGLLVSIAPARAYSAGEQKAIRDFVRRGGIWVAMVGADRSGPINRALADFELRVPPSSLYTGDEGAEPLPIRPHPGAVLQSRRSPIRSDLRLRLAGGVPRRRRRSACKARHDRADGRVRARGRRDDRPDRRQRVCDQSEPGERRRAAFGRRARERGLLAVADRKGPRPAGLDASRNSAAQGRAGGRRGGDAMMRAWIALALLSVSWLWGLDYYRPANGVLWSVAMVLAVLLLSGAPLRLPRRREGGLAVVLLLPAAWWMPWPYRMVPLAIAVGLGLQLVPIPRRWPGMIGRGAVAAGVILLVQAVVLWAYECHTARSHELPWPLPSLLGAVASLLGVDAAVDGNTLALYTFREVLRPGATWELLLDPATLAFLVGGLALLGWTVLNSAPVGHRWRTWLRAVRTFAILLVAWLPLRAGLLLGFSYTGRSASIRRHA